MKTDFFPEKKMNKTSLNCLVSTGGDFIAIITSNSNIIILTNIILSRHYIQVSVVSKYTKYQNISNIRILSVIIVIIIIYKLSNTR